MKKILTAVMISAMIAMCSCGVNKDSADNARCGGFAALKRDRQAVTGCQI